MRTVVDLFCGAGGASTGLARACEQLGLERPSLVAVNHWTVAVETHRLNHPWAQHHCARVESLDPQQICGGRADLIVAGVECTHHSQARGGKPMSDQSRASAWHVVHWAEQLRTRDILIENVPEFRNWGPIDAKGKPIKSRKGETFQAFLQALDSLGYRVEWKILNSADYGDPQRRRRLFLRARAHNRRIVWPDQTHAEQPDLVAQPWRTAREIIDWGDLGSSIFTRKRPLAKRTIDRIAEGIRRFCGEHAEAFLIMLYGQSTARSVDLPLPTVTGSGHLALIHPFMIPRHGERPTQAPRTHDVDAPAPTIAATNAPNLVMPFILPHDQFTKSNGAFVDDVGKPLRTVTAHNGGDTRVVSPFLVPYYRTGTPHHVGEPLQTVTTRDRFALVTPDGHALDIFFRMLKPRELARAQSFPDDYEFVGNKGETIRQIGNAWPVETATALCSSILQRGKRAA